jgi:hypothetical protein
VQRTTDKCRRWFEPSLQWAVDRKSHHLAQQNRHAASFRCSTEKQNGRRSNSSIPDREALYHWSHCRTGNRFHKFVGLYVRFGSGDLAADDHGHKGTTTCSRSHSIFGRTDLRIRCQNDQRQRRPRRHEVLPAGVLAVHVHPGFECDWDLSLRIHSLKPSHRHRGAGAADVLSSCCFMACTTTA